jgi:hypothetical protein
LIDAGAKFSQQEINKLDKKSGGEHCLLYVFSALARNAAFYDANFDIFNLEFTRAVEWKNGNGYPCSAGM